MDAAGVGQVMGHPVNGRGGVLVLGGQYSGVVQQTWHLHRHQWHHDNWACALLNGGW